MTAASNAETLCLCCGFCCDGTLFATGPLKPIEVDSARRVGLRVLTNEQGFRQPCSALSERSCTVYTDRPTACRAYRCDLLNALESDEVSIKEAQQIVGQVRARLERTAAALPADTDPPEERVPLLQRARRSEPDEALQAELARASELLVFHFRGRRG